MSTYIYIRPSYVLHTHVSVTQDWVLAVENILPKHVINISCKYTVYRDYTLLCKYKLLSSYNKPLCIVHSSSVTIHDYFVPIYIASSADAASLKNEDIRLRVGPVRRCCITSWQSGHVQRAISRQTRSCSQPRTHADVATSWHKPAALQAILALSLNI